MEGWTDFKVMSSQYAMVVSDWAFRHQEFVYTCIAMFLLIAAVEYYRIEKKRRYDAKRKQIVVTKGENMGVTERTSYVKSKLADIIGDGLLEAEVKGELTSEEVSKTLQMCANIFSLDDLLPRQRKVLKKTLREAQRRRKVGHPEDHPKLPGDKPPAVTENKYPMEAPAPPARKSILSIFSKAA